MPNALEQIRRYTTIVVDSSDIDHLAIYKPQDATTNPTLVLQAAEKEQYRPIESTSTEITLTPSGLRLILNLCPLKPAPSSSTPLPTPKTSPPTSSKGAKSSSSLPIRPTGSSPPF